jgi:hypothetical protein
VLVAHACPAIRQTCAHPLPRALRHSTVKYLHQAGAKAAFIRLADHGVRDNSYVIMLEKNNKEIAAVIAGWLDKTIRPGAASTSG